MNKTPDQQHGFSLETTKSLLAADIFIDENLLNMCRTSTRAWTKLTGAIIAELEKAPADRNTDMLMPLLRNLINGIKQNLNTIKKFKSGRQRNISRSQIAQSFCNKVAGALSLLYAPLEELGLKDFYSGLLAANFQIDSGDINVRFHIWETFTQLSRPKGTGKLEPLTNGRVSVTSVLSIPPSADEAAAAKKLMDDEKTRVKKSTEEILARHLFIRPVKPANSNEPADTNKKEEQNTEPAAAEPEPPTVTPEPPKPAPVVETLSDPFAMPKNVRGHKEADPFAQTEAPPKSNIPSSKTPAVQPVKTESPKTAPQKPRSGLWKKIAKGVGIAAAAIASMIGIDEMRKSEPLPRAAVTATMPTPVENSAATPPAKSVPAPQASIIFTQPPASAQPKTGPIHSSAIAINSAYKPADSTTAPSKIASAQPAPAISASASATDKTPEEKSPQAAQAPSAPAHYGFDFEDPSFNKYKDTYFKQSLFTTAFNYAAENSDILLTGRESKMEAKLALYKSFLENGMREYAHNGAIRIFFTVRLRTLNKLMEKISSGEYILGSENPFSARENFEDRLLFNAMPQPRLKPPVNPGVRYAVEIDESKNPYIPTGLNSIRRSTGLVEVIAAALPQINCPTAEQHAFNECAYTTIESVAEEYRKKKPNHGAKNLLETLHEMDKKNRTTFLGKMLRVKKEIEVGGDAGNRKIHIPSPVETNDPVEELNKLQQQAPAIPSAPMPEYPFGNTPDASVPTSQDAADDSVTNASSPDVSTTTFNENDTEWFTDGAQMSAQNEKQAEANRKWVAAYPEWFPDEPQPERPGYLTRAFNFVKNLVSPPEKTAEELEEAELKRSIPKKSFLRNLFG